MQNNLYTPCLHVDLAFQIQSIALLSGPFFPHKQALQTHLSEVHEVLEAGVEVRLLPQGTYVLKVRVIDVCIHPEKPLENAVNDVFELEREWFSIMLGKEPWVINLITHDEITVNTGSNHFVSERQMSQKSVTGVIFRAGRGCHLCFNPITQGIDVLRCCQAHRLLDLHSVCPEVLILYGEHRSLHTIAASQG